MIISSDYGTILRVLKFCGKIITSHDFFTIENPYAKLFWGRTFLIVRPAKSPDLGRRLPAFSLHCRLSGFDVYFTGEIENLQAFFFQIEYFMIYGNQVSIRDCRS